MFRLRRRAAPHLPGSQDPFSAFLRQLLKMAPHAFMRVFTFVPQLKTASSKGSKSADTFLLTLCDRLMLTLMTSISEE
jgi:hypothetical protein